jgi:hypothetical protein
MQFYDGAVISTIEEQREATWRTTTRENTPKMSVTAANIRDNGNGRTNHNISTATELGSSSLKSPGSSAPSTTSESKIYSSRSFVNSTKNTSLGIPMHPVPEIEIAELTKIVENAHRYLQIAFAEDLYLYCQKNNINFAELRDSLNTKWNVNVLEPREGIGGHCLPKDTKMFLNSSRSVKSKIIEAAIQSDLEYRRYRENRAGITPYVDQASP